MNDIANAIRNVTACMQKALDQGRRSRTIDAEDLIDILLAIADELDPPLADVVPVANACPACGERRTDRLVWKDDLVHCARCGSEYRPG